MDGFPDAARRIQFKAPSQKHCINRYSSFYFSILGLNIFSNFVCQEVCKIIYKTKKTARRLILAVFVHYILLITDMIESSKITCYSQILSISCFAEVKSARKCSVYFCKPRNQRWVTQIRIIVNVNFKVVILRSLFVCHEINSENRRLFTVKLPYISETQSFIFPVIAKSG